MRLAIALASFAAITCASAAAADQVLITPIAYSPQFERALAHDLGESEGAYLSDDVTRAVTRALERRGASIGQGGVTLEIAIVSADPNRYTRTQFIRSPNVNRGLSFSRGGAELHAVIRSADGRILSEVNHRYYDDTFSLPSTWETAERAINQFAEKVADAYDAQTTH